MDRRTRPAVPTVPDTDALEPAWSRRWDAGHRGYYQALYALETASSGVVGVRVTVLAIGDDPVNSFATAEVFDGTQWHGVSTLPGPNMACSRHVNDPELLDRDVKTVLRDVGYAYSLRAPGPGVQVTRTPPAETP